MFSVLRKNDKRLGWTRLLNTSSATLAGVGVICCVFTKFLTSQLFWRTPHLQLIPNSTPHMSFILLSFKLHLSFYLSFYLFSVLSVNSILFLSTTSCFTLWSFFVPWYLFIILCLRMWISFACDFICALLHPSLPFPYRILWYFLFDSTPISVVMTTLYESDSIYNKL